MQEVYKAIGRVAGQNINVLIRGESGTGKELVARAIHQHSTRVGKKFLAVNCAAIPESLLESELFGHEKGSFTGAASQRIGKFEECDGGTLFLDEVGDMPIAHAEQSAPRNSREGVPACRRQSYDQLRCRIVAATNRDLEAMVASGEFRADLCYRLNGYTILLPPLRDRRDDIPLLVEYYLCRFNAEIGKSISGVAPETMERLKQYSWPGNIRELQTVLKHAMLHAIGPSWCRSSCRRSCAKIGSIDLSAVPMSPGQRNAAAAETAGGSPAEHGEAAFHEFIESQLRGGTDSLYADSVKYMERILLTDVLSHTNGNQSQAALLLGITRGCLRSKLRTHGNHDPLFRRRSGTSSVSLTGKGPSGGVPGERHRRYARASHGREQTAFLHGAVSSILIPEAPGRCSERSAVARYTWHFPANVRWHETRTEGIVGISYQGRMETREVRLLFFPGSTVMVNQQILKAIGMRSRENLHSWGNSTDEDLSQFHGEVDSLWERFSGKRAKGERRLRK